MDIGDVAESERTVRVIAAWTTVFVASISQLICLCIKLRSGVINNDLAGEVVLVGIALSDNSEEFFIFSFPRTPYSDQGLRTPPD